MLLEYLEWTLSYLGNFTGDVVYVNYGDTVDFDLLAEEGTDYTTDVRGKICMMRYGKVRA